MTKEDIAGILKELRVTSGITQKEAAEKLGKKQQTVASWETGQSQPDANTLFVLCDIYGTTVDEAFGFNKKNVRISSDNIKLLEKYNTLDVQGQETVSYILDREVKRVQQLFLQAHRITELESNSVPRRIITYYQRLASAGSGEYLFDNIPTDTIEVPITDVSEQADFVIGVNGDSMEPTYRDGEKVYVSIASEIPNGSIGVFTKGNECYIKELGEDRLISHNKSCEDISGGEDVKLVGKVIGKVEEYL